MRTVSTSSISGRLLPARGLHGALLLAASLLSASCGSPDAKVSTEGASSAAPAGSAKVPSSRAVRVEVATLSAISAASELRVPGEVEASRDALLGAAIGGFIEAVRVKIGDTVKAGQPLVAVDTATHGARLSVARVELRAAEREAERARKLQGSLPQAQLDAAEVRVEAARANAKLAEVSIGRSVVSAPFTGTVVEVNAEVGEIAAPGAPLVRVVQTKPAKITVSLSDRDVLAVEEGGTALVSTESQPQPVQGVVRHVRRAADLKTRTFLAEVEVPNEERALLPGMIATVRIGLPASEARVLVSQDWLVTRLDAVGAFVLEGDRARYRELALGPVVGRNVVVDKGLAAGDALIVTGHRDLAEGDAVIVARRGTCCTEGRIVFAEEPKP